MKNETTNTILAFLVGAATGGIAALLLAPSSGTELRRRIGDGADKVGKDAVATARAGGQKVAETYEATSAKAREVAGEIKTAAESQRQGVKQAFKEGKAAYDKELTKAS
jgi:gas vesicle protein